MLEYNCVQTTLKWKLSTILFADNTVLIVQNDRDLHKLFKEYNNMLKGRTVMKKALHDSITVPTIMYGSETWTWNEGQRSRIKAVERCLWSE